MIRRLIGTLLAGFLVATTSNAATFSTTQYTVFYDGLSSLGTLTNSSFSGGAASFSWDIPASAVSVSGDNSYVLMLPELAVVPKAGYTLSGPVKLSLGNFIFAEANGGATYASLFGQVVVDGGAPVVIDDLPLDKTVTGNFPTGVIGTYARSEVIHQGAFGSLYLPGTAVLFLTGNNGANGFAGIASQSTNVFSISFIAAAVPESETYAMMLAGLCLLGAIVGRRKSEAV